MNAWAESIVPIILSLIEQLAARDSQLQSQHLHSNRGFATSDALEGRLSDLQSKLLEAEKKTKYAESQRDVIGTV